MQSNPPDIEITCSSVFLQYTNRHVNEMNFLLFSFIHNYQDNDLNVKNHVKYPFIHSIYIFIVWQVVYMASCGCYRLKVKRKRWSICIAPCRENLTSKALRCRSHSITCQHTTPALISIESFW